MPSPRSTHRQCAIASNILRWWNRRTSRAIKRWASSPPCNPAICLPDMNWAAARLGPQRARNAYAWKAFLDAGVPLAFGTDYPVEPITPFRGIYAAVTRSNEAGRKSYFPQDKLTIDQVLFAYTQGSAYAEFSESFKGKLVPGYVADFIVLDRDLTRSLRPRF